MVGWVLLMFSEGTKVCPLSGSGGEVRESQPVSLVGEVVGSGCHLECLPAGEMWFQVNSLPEERQTAPIGDDFEPLGDVLSGCCDADVGGVGSL